MSFGPTPESETNRFIESIATELGPTSLPQQRARSAANSGRLDEARAHLSEAMRFAREIGSPTLEAGVRSDLGTIELYAGNLGAAALEFRRCFDQLGDKNLAEYHRARAQRDDKGTR